MSSLVRLSLFGQVMMGAVGISFSVPVVDKHLSSPQYKEEQIAIKTYANVCVLPFPEIVKIASAAKNAGLNPAADNPKKPGDDGPYSFSGKSYEVMINRGVSGNRPTVRCNLRLKNKNLSWEVLKQLMMDFPGQTTPTPPLPAGAAYVTSVSYAESNASDPIRWVRWDTPKGRTELSYIPLFETNMLSIDNEQKVR